MSTVKLDKTEAMHINSILNQLKKESPQVRENVLSLSSKIVDIFKDDGVGAKDKLELELTDSERISAFRAVMSILSVPDYENALLVWGKTAGKVLGFEKQLRKNLNLDEKIETPKDFKFDEEFEILEEA